MFIFFLHWILKIYLEFFSIAFSHVGKNSCQYMYKKNTVLKVDQNSEKFSLWEEIKQFLSLGYSII